MAHIGLTKLTDILTLPKTEEEAKEFIKRLRFGEIVVCPYCGERHVWSCKGYYKCSKCHKKFSITSGTFLHSTKIPLVKWCAAMYFFSVNRRGLSAIQLSKYLNISYKCSWYLMMRLRFALPNYITRMRECVCVDEVYVGGLWSNKHYKVIPQGKAAKWKENAKYKTPIVGMVELREQVNYETGEVTKEVKQLYLPIVEKVTPDSVKTLLTNTIEGFYKEDGKNKHTILCTDGGHVYFQFDKIFEHHTVNHSMNNYIDKEGYSSNPIECAFSHLQRFYNGTHIHITRKYLQLYLNEFSQRYAKDDIDLNILVWKSALGYKNLCHNGSKLTKMSVQNKL